MKDCGCDREIESSRVPDRGSNGSTENAPPRRRRRVVWIAWLCLFVLGLGAFVAYERALCGITMQISDVTVVQTCKHSTGVRQDTGEKVCLTPGLLQVTGDLEVRNSSVFPKKALVSPLVLVSQAGGRECSLWDRDPRSHKWNRPAPESLTLRGLQSRSFKVSCVVDGPARGMGFTTPYPIGFGVELVMPELGPGGSGLTLTMDEEVSFRSAAVWVPIFDEQGRLGGRFQLGYKISLSNNTDATWIFDLEEAVRVEDEAGSTYRLLTKSSGC